MQGLSVELIVQTIIEFWPFFATVALVFLMIFRLGSISRRLEKEVGLQRARINELMLMFQDLQRGGPPSRASSTGKSLTVAATVAAAEKNPDVEAARPEMPAADPAVQAEQRVEEQTAAAAVAKEPPVNEPSGTVVEPAADSSSGDSPFPTPPETPLESPVEESPENQEALGQFSLESSQEETSQAIHQESPGEEAPEDQESLDQFSFESSQPEASPEIPREYPPEEESPASEDFEQSHQETPAEKGAQEPSQESSPENSSPAPSTPEPDRAILVCESCGNKLAYRRNLSGKRARCPACKTVLRLP
ncbi:MAG: hypothetical protein GX751_10570 [Desulfuromonadaceae bacterium]|nr:hypothetical protein [Desulfuromonadaceae bacterium]